MRRLTTTLALLLPLPALAADNPATLETLQARIATLTTTVNSIKPNSTA